MVKEGLALPERSELHVEWSAAAPLQLNVHLAADANVLWYYQHRPASHLYQPPDLRWLDGLYTLLAYPSTHHKPMRQALQHFYQHAPFAIVQSFNKCVLASEQAHEIHPKEARTTAEIKRLEKAEEKESMSSTDKDQQEQKVSH